MSLVARSSSSSSSRGGRGRGQGAGVWRGSNTRGGHNGASVEASDKPVFGAKKRGGGPAAQNGGSTTRNNNNTGSRGRNGGDSQELDDEGKPKKKAAFVPLNKYGTVPNSTPHQQDDYKNRFLYLQAAQPSWRQQLQAKKLMNPDGQMKLSDSVKLIGLCNDMCPEYERVRRIEQMDFKRPECTPETEHAEYNKRTPDESRMVKAFTRSSAGADVELVIDIRSPAACLKTVSYLFKRLDNEGFDYLHAWIWDRTRSVRKDLRTQVVEKRNDIQTLLTCLEASARFYLLSMHQMAQTEKEDYSHQQDMEQFNQTLTTLRERYDDNRRAGIASDNEAEFVAYRLILASLYANSQLENELHGLPSDLRHNKRVLTAIEIFRAAKSAFNFGTNANWIQAQANWKKFWGLIKSPSVSYLMACAAEVSFNRVRHVILDSLWHAYRKGPRGDLTVDAWTTDKLVDVLAMDDHKDAVRLCELFGFQFERNAQGVTYLDIAKLGNSNNSIGVPHNIKPQMFSESLVESKRHNRAFSAVIQGLTVQQAKKSGLLANPSAVQKKGEDSLFIPESATTKPNIFAQNLNGATTNGTSKPNPFVSPFNPTSQVSSGNSSPNPFLNNAFTNTTPQKQTFGGGASPGLFDATKNSIQFAPSPSTTKNPFGSPAPSILPQSTTLASTPATSFSFPASSTPQSQLIGDPTVSNSSQANDSSSSQTPKPFVFPGLAGLDAKIRNEQLGASTTPAGSPPPPDAAEQAAQKQAEQQKAEEEARAAVLKRKQEAEEQRKRAQEEQERKAREAQQAQEAEQRRIEEEKQRQLREQRDRELRAKQERERLIREEQQRREQEEQKRLARIRQREAAYNALTSNIIFGAEEGLLYQFLENTVKNVAEEVMVEVQAERRRAREAVEKEQRQLVFARSVFAHWVAQVQKKKRNAKARERRRRLKAQREQPISGDGENGEGDTTATESVAGTDLLNGASTTRHAPINSRRARRTQERHTSASTAQAQAAASQPPTQSAAMTNGHSLHVRSYSEAYQKSTAPIDRTETDWFKLRAMGIDPSKHRKRSFDSATDEESKGDAEAKRVRRSDSSASLVSQHPLQPEAPSQPLTIEERLARIRAAKQFFRASASTPPPVNGATSINGRSSFNGRASHLIAQARDLIAKPPTSKPVVHDFGRSVPNLGTSVSSFSRSTLGKSVGAGASQSNKPAYWARASRFVPQHLYGKGPDAIRAYRDQYVHSPSSTPRPLSTEPLALSSPIATQLSYAPPKSLPEYSFSEDGSGVDLVNVDAGDDDGAAADTELESQVGDEDEDDELQSEADEQEQFDAYAEYDEFTEVEDEDVEDDDEEEDEDEDEQFAQQAQIGPGATQDDAIELSD